MSTVHAFFSQRKKDLASGTTTSDLATVEKLYGAATSAIAPDKRTFHVAVQGCCHGDLSQIYAACAAHERETNKKIDFLICCGDFQSTRDAADLASMAVPEKHKQVGDFPKYYRPLFEQGPDGGERLADPIAPYLTLFVGGNHENSDWLAEESYGGFLAANIYYLGHSGVVEVDGKLRVGGLSGIFKSIDYTRPYPEHRPYSDNESAKRSAYHTRKIEQEKLLCYCRAMSLIRSGRRSGTAVPAGGEDPATVPSVVRRESPVMVDVMISHDWPAGVTKYGDEEQLLRYKPYFREEVSHNALGNPHTMSLMREAKPQHWFAAHLHCFFTATVPHRAEAGVGQAGCSTHFMALDKCAKKKGFLDFVDIPICATTAAGEETAEVEEEEAPPTAAAAAKTYASRVRRDPVWLAVLRRSHAFLATNRTGGSDGFDAEAEAHLIAAEFLSGSNDNTNGVSLCQSPETQSTPTTASLLRGLGLSPAVPLQLSKLAQPPLQERQQTRPSHTAARRGGDAGPCRAHCAALVEQTAASPLEPLGWAEDLG